MSPTVTSTAVDYVSGQNADLAETVRACRRLWRRPDDVLQTAAEELAVEETMAGLRSMRAALVSGISESELEESLRAFAAQVKSWVVAVAATADALESVAEPFFKIGTAARSGLLEGQLTTTAVAAAVQQAPAVAAAIQQATAVAGAVQQADKVSALNPDEFWRERSLVELASEQEVRTPQDVYALLGAGAHLWEDDGGFAEFIEEIHARRRQEPS